MSAGGRWTRGRQQQLIAEQLDVSVLNDTQRSLIVPLIFEQIQRPEITKAELLRFIFLSPELSAFRDLSNRQLAAFLRCSEGNVSRVLQGLAATPCPTVAVSPGRPTILSREAESAISDWLRQRISVMDWPTMKELQRAYLLSGVANLDVPQDHLFCAAIYQMARKYRVRYILNGSNIATEGADAPFSLQHTYRDAWHLRSIYRKHGRGKSLKKYPALSLWEAWMGLPGVTKINLLNYVPYSKKEAIETLTREFG